MQENDIRGKRKEASVKGMPKAITIKFLCVFALQMPKKLGKSGFFGAEKIELVYKENKNILDKMTIQRAYIKNGK